MKVIISFILGFLSCFFFYKTPIELKVIEHNNKLWCPPEAGIYARSQDEFYYIGERPYDILYTTIGSRTTVLHPCRS